MNCDRSAKRSMLITWGIGEIGKGRTRAEIEKEIGKWMKRPIQEVRDFVKCSKPEAK
jgi:hypothetical protein